MGLMPHAIAGPNTWALTLAEQISVFAGLVCPATNSLPIRESVSHDIQYHSITSPIRLPNGIRGNNSVVVGKKHMNQLAQVGKLVVRL